jgi:ubiquinone/menaquinone biosynthesis C-methylase UbiE
MITHATSHHRLQVTAHLRPIWVSLDRYVGRGSYSWLRPWLGPERVCAQRAYAEKVASLLRASTRWLDAGCGHRIFDFASASEERQMVGRIQSAVGCDLDASALRNHRSLTNRVCCNLRQMPFPDGSFDLVTLNYVVEHIEDVHGTFAEISRVLVPDGHLVILTPNVRSYYVRLIRLGTRLLPKFVIQQLARYLEYREPEDIFPTFDRANTQQVLSEHLKAVDMHEEKLLLLTGQPLFYFAAPLSALEMALCRLMLWLGWFEFEAETILAVYRRTRRGLSEAASAINV